ncbi:MAG: serine/threonine protein phosphatase [Caulobacterales bacterium]|nr:serine/threonine protein phosphatase [Caulobacterales bacterium]
MAFTYAIGDIHGRDALLERMHARIEHDPHRPKDAPGPVVVHLGDYIDGGPESHKVLDRVMRGSEAFETVALLGNHETLMLDCLETDDRDVWWNWLSNGGDKTLDAFGIPFKTNGFDPRALNEALGAVRIRWLRSLPIYHVIDHYLFVHAGIVPGIPLEDQQAKDMIWIRGRFLESSADHGYTVVHGHTQTEEPDVRSNRIGIDTGAARPKTLTAAALDGSKPPRFLSVSEG